MDYQRGKGKFIFCITLAFFLLSSCSTHKNISLDELKKQPERKLETYNSSLDLPVLEKIQIPPKPILDYLNRMDGTDAYTGYELTHDEEKLFSEYFDYLPQPNTARQKTPW